MRLEVVRRGHASLRPILDPGLGVGRHARAREGRRVEAAELQRAAVARAERCASKPRRLSSNVKSTSGSAFRRCVSTAARSRPSSRNSDTRAPHASDASPRPPTASTSTPSLVASATAAMESLLDLCRRRLSFRRIRLGLALGEGRLPSLSTPLRLDDRSADAGSAAIKDFQVRDRREARRREGLAGRGPARGRRRRRGRSGSLRGPSEPPRHRRDACPCVLISTPAVTAVARLRDVPGHEPRAARQVRLDQEPPQEGHAAASQGGSVQSCSHLRTSVDCAAPQRCATRR